MVIALVKGPGNCMYRISNGDIVICITVAVAGSLVETIALLYPVGMWLLRF
jgi:hypothetical protein